MKHLLYDLMTLVQFVNRYTEIPHFHVCRHMCTFTVYIFMIVLVLST